MVSGQLVKNYIIIHHSFSTDRKELLDVPGIRAYHKSLGWNDVGYHFLLDRIGSDVEIIIGRMPNEVGAHTKECQMNRRSFGICAVGNFDRESPPIDVWEKALDLCIWLQQSFNIETSHVLGHREAQAMGGLPPEQRKSCPGLRWNMDKFRAALDSAVV